MKKKLIIFDFDGPIVNSWHLSYNRTLNRWPETTEKTHRDLFSKNIFKELSKMPIPINSDEDAKKYANDVYWPNKLELKPVVGIKEVIKNLSQGYTLVVNSSSSGDFIGKYLEKYNLREYFDGIYGTEVSLDKTEKFNLILKEWNLGAGDCVAITDTVGDVIEAEKVGIKSIVVTWGYQKMEHFEEIKNKILSVVDLPEEILGVVNKQF